MRTTHRFIGSVRAAEPTTRSAHAAFHFGNCFLDTDVARLLKLARRDPADPLVARERRDVLPQSKYFRLRDYSLSKVFGKFMYRPSCDACAHVGILSNRFEMRTNKSKAVLQRLALGTVLLTRYVAPVVGQ